MMTLRLGLVAALIGGLSAHAAEPKHAIAMHGEPALPAGFSHFGYVNPDAPKGGRLVQGVLGSFDGLNPFIVRGLPPQGLRAPLVSGSNLIAGFYSTNPANSAPARSFPIPSQTSFTRWLNAGASASTPLYAISSPPYRRAILPRR